MSNSYKTVKELLSEVPSLRSFLLNEETYWAHRPKERDSVKQPETLHEHVELVNTYFEKLVNIHQIDKSIDSLIQKYLQDVNITNLELGNEIKKQFVNSIVFHDYGKVNEAFQADKDKMDNPEFYGKERANSPIATNHSALGAFIYLAKHFNDIFDKFKDNQPYLLLSTAFFFSYSIFKHHSPKIDDDVDITLYMAYIMANKDKKEVIDFMSPYFKEFQYDINPGVLQYIGDKKVLERYVFKTFCKSASLYALVKMNFSLLTASDYLATNEYSSELSTTDFGVFSQERIDELYDNVSKHKYLDSAGTKLNYNAKTYEDLDTCDFKNPIEMSGENLNILRKEMGVEVLRNIRNNLDKNLFYIEAPTGGGKTNLSILATIELLKGHKEKLNKVFYVFPFTTLITQTFGTLKEVLGLKEDEIVELHSRSGFSEKEEHDGQYGKDKLNYISNLFAHYPVSLLSHISFFDILKTNRKEKNYLFHRLANSIVVIDELQSYSPSHWDKLIYFIRFYAATLNIKFILMSATLPKLDKLLVLKEDVKDFVYLIPEARAKYFQNPNFSGRVDFDFDYFERTDLKLPELADRLVSESEIFAELDYGSAKPYGSVYTIIEFIYKQSASEFYEILKTDDFFDEIFVLSGTILEHRRQYIINFLKNKDNRIKKVLLITTQVVEAGVDIDMDLGFKDRSLIDSDEQLAGRINRNVNKKNCKLFLFNYNKESAIYGKDIRLKITREQIKAPVYKQILETKDFDRLYDLVINNRNNWNDQLMVVNFGEYENHVKKLKFTKVHEEFKLIDSNNISCFLPLDIAIEIGDEDNKISFFKESELAFLAKYKIYPTIAGEIKGAEVFDLYLDIIQNRMDFTEQRIREKILQSIMSKFIISIFATENIEAQLVHFSDLDKSKFGYQYISHWQEFYSVEGGMDNLKFKGVEETQFL